MRLTNHEYEKLSLEYEQNPPELSGKTGFITAMREKALISKLLPPEYARIVNVKASAMSMSPTEMLQFLIKEHMVGNA